MFTYILNRLSERSTWLGLVALFSSCGLTIQPSHSDAIIAAGIALAGLIGIVSKEKEEVHHG